MYRTPFFIAFVCLNLFGFRFVNSQEPAPSKQLTKLKSYPASLSLSGKDSSGLVVIQKLLRTITGESAGKQLTEDVRIESADPAIAVWKDGRIHAVADGKTEILIQSADSDEVRVPVDVQGTTVPQRWQFDAHVQSVLTRAGCNSGACHGALAGKGGFRLSLRAYDSLTDHFTITRQDRGRRIEPADPGLSLLIAKPTTLIAHKGGLRLREGSADYRLLAEWIAGGAVGPQESDPKLLSVEVLPNAIELAKDDVQQLIVRATYSDGRTDDVTHWAKFNSSNEAVARVDENGRVQVVGNGKGAVVASFSSRVAISSVVVPYENTLSPTAYIDFQPRNLIDTALQAEWQALRLAPSAKCDDATFLRRVYLDTTGTLPTSAQVKAFLGDNRSDRRDRAIEELLSSDAFVDYWSYKWSDLLLVNGTLLRPEAVASFYKWIRQNVEKNTPWDEFCKQIVLARGESMTDGATNFYAIHQDPESLTENTCQAFMGLSIGCAKCHNHPLEKWTNDQYYSMANLYARVRAKGWGGDSRSGDGQRTLLVLDRGDLIQPSRGKPQIPSALDAQPIDINATGDRREALAAWLTSPDNPYFSRAIVNRVWANFMGLGLVESVDDLRVSNPSCSERLLDELAKFAIDNHYDLKAVMRLILQSQTYQRSAEAIPGNAADNRFYCRYYPRRLMAEVLHDAIVTVTGVPTKFTEIEFPGSDKSPTKDYPEGTRSLELHDSAVANYFLKTFGRHQRRITCDCERSDQPTVIQVLHLNNGTTINEKLSAPESIVGRWLKENLPLEEVIDQAYLATLSRSPSAEERSKMLTLVANADKDNVARRESFEDVLWSLMTSPEFLFAH
jgi:Protein of unknown function (DUF1553)/Protein of unknown function (DUF1549)/Bacterial Ig-like domain (group 2)